MTKVSIVVAAYQAASTIGRTVDSLLACRGADAAEIIVVDDGSDDTTAAAAQRAGVRVHRISHRGRSAALNEGLSLATGEVVLFTDADCVVPPTWIENTMAELGSCDGVGGNLIPSRGTVVELAKVLRYIEEFERPADLVGDYRGICLNGNNMALRRSALDAVGGFDEGFVHGADADLTRRLLAQGFRLRRTTATHVTHLKVDDLRSFLQTMWRRGSTVRFGMKKGDENVLTLARALALSPVKWLFIDLFRVPRLRALGGVGRGPHIWLTPFVNLFGGIATGLGRIHFFRRFRKELP
ncbi:MAG: glycosyltransferase [Candidatus Lernaella stagnicola]|nr:glycosyltransferase [Candidatus Lernaella stagnicola]